MHKKLFYFHVLVLFIFAHQAFADINHKLVIGGSGADLTTF